MKPALTPSVAAECHDRWPGQAHGCPVKVTLKATRGLALVGSAATPGPSSGQTRGRGNLHRSAPGWGLLRFARSDGKVGASRIPASARATDCLLHRTIRRRMPPVPDAPLDRTGPLAQELLELTARHYRPRRGRPVRQSCPAGGAGDQPAHRGRCAGRCGDRRADRAPARRRLRRPRTAHRRLCRRHRHGGAYRGAAGTGAAPAAAGSERQPGALGRVSRPGGADALCRGVHRASDIRAPRRGGARAGGDRQRPGDRDRGIASPATDHAGRRVRPGRGCHRPWPRRHRPVQCRASVGGAQCLAGSLDRTRPATGDPVELGGLRHRRSHRHRLVGHAAAAAGDEAPAACAAACADRRVAGNRGARRAHRRGAGCGRRTARALSRTRPNRRGSPRSHRRWWGGAKPR